SCGAIEVDDARLPRSHHWPGRDDGSSPPMRSSSTTGARAKGSCRVAPSPPRGLRLPLTWQARMPSRDCGRPYTATFGKHAHRPSHGGRGGAEVASEGVLVRCSSPVGETAPRSGLMTTLRYRFERRFSLARRRGWVRLGAAVLALAVSGGCAPGQQRAST